jgi:hypothetical protein
VAGDDKNRQDSCNTTENKSKIMRNRRQGNSNRVTEGTRKMEMLNNKNIQRGSMSKRIQRNKRKRTNWWRKNMTTVFNL